MNEIEFKTKYRNAIEFLSRKSISEVQKFAKFYCVKQKLQPTKQALIEEIIKTAANMIEPYNTKFLFDSALISKEDLDFFQSLLFSD